MQGGALHYGLQELPDFETNAVEVNGIRERRRMRRKQVFGEIST